MNGKHGMTLIAIASLLAACGGGGSGSSAPAATPAASGLSLSGTAATGGPIAGKAVDAKCGGGNGTTTTASDGSYTLTIAGGTLPCLLRTTAADGTVLHTIAGGSGSSATANITPVTQLIVATIAGTDPATYFSNFGSTAAAAVTAANIAAAQAAVVATLKAGGVDVSGLGDLIAAALKPKTASAAGDAYDQALEKLATALSGAGTSLAALTGTLVSSAIATPSTSTSTVSLPPEMLLRPAAPHCSALRSGSYRVVAPTTAGRLADEYGLITIDAPAETFVDLGGTTVTLSAATDTRACHYTTDGGKTDIVVSQAGVIAARNSNATGPYTLAIAFPEQSHTLAELAGTWNGIGLEGGVVPGTFVGTTTHYTVDASGNLAAGALVCANANWSVKTADCQTVTPTVAFRLDGAGGFDSADLPGGAVNGRFFVYKAGNGELMAVHVDGDGSIQLATRDRTLSLPTLNSAGGSWNLYVGNQLTLATPMDSASNTIASIDTTANSYVRTQQTDGTSNAHPETVFVNNPRPGYSFRPAGTSTTAAGTVVNFGEWTQLPLRGMGISGLLLPSRSLFDVAVQHP